MLDYAKIFGYTSEVVGKMLKLMQVGLSGHIAK